jgi:zinc transporter ZupT
MSFLFHNFHTNLFLYFDSFFDDDIENVEGLEIGLPLMIAIAAHNIPEGMAVASPMYHSTRRYVIEMH